VIVVAGEALIDLIGATGGRTLDVVAGGGPYNTARAIARLGMPCQWLGVLSSDGFGRMLEAELIADGVGIDLVQRTELPTTLALAELGEDGSATYRFYVEGTSAPVLQLEPLARGLPPGTIALHVGTLGLVLEPMGTTIERLADDLDPAAVLMIDPNARPSVIPDLDVWRARLSRLMRRADIVRASREDLEVLCPGESPESAARWIIGSGPSVVVVTDGADPVLVEVDGIARWVSTPSVKVVDTVAAGDTFGGAFLACLAKQAVGRGGLSEPVVVEAVLFALRASAAVCERRGSDLPTLADLGGWPSR
jgi:fructokinase